MLETALRPLARMRSQISFLQINYVVGLFTVVWIPMISLVLRIEWRYVYSLGDFGDFFVCEFERCII